MWVCVILILGACKSLNKCQQNLTKLNTKTRNICRNLKSCKMSYLALVGIAHHFEEYVTLWFYSIFIKTNSPSTSNRNGRISKSELYHTSQQLSQHDYPIRIFSHKHKCMYMEQNSCKLLS